MHANVLLLQNENCVKLDKYTKLRHIHAQT